jgi:hypothetical protein
MPEKNRNDDDRRNRTPDNRNANMGQHGQRGPQQADEDRRKAGERAPQSQDRGTARQADEPKPTRTPTRTPDQGMDDDDRRPGNKNDANAGRTGQDRDKR